MPTEESEKDLDKKYFAAYKNLNNEETESDAKSENVREVETSSKRESCSKSKLPSAMKRNSGQRPDNGVENERFSKGSIDFRFSEESKFQEVLKPTESQKEFRASFR